MEINTTYIKSVTITGAQVKSIDFIAEGHLEVSVRPEIVEKEVEVEKIVEKKVFVKTEPPEDGYGTEINPFIDKRGNTLVPGCKVEIDDFSWNATLFPGASELEHAETSSLKGKVYTVIALDCKLPRHDCRSSYGARFATRMNNTIIVSECGITVFTCSTFLRKK